MGSAQTDNAQPVARKKPFKSFVLWYGTELFVPKGIFKATRINNTPSCAGVTVSGTAFLSAALLHTAGGVLEGFRLELLFLCPSVPQSELKPTWQGGVV